MTQFDYFLCGVVKEKCYAKKPETTDSLRANICDEIADIRKLHDNWSVRIRRYVDQPWQPYECNNISFLTG